MRNLSILNKLFFLLNILLALVMLVGFALPYFSPKSFPALAVLTLGFPFLLILNLIFIIFWAIQFKRQIWVSLVIFLIGLPSFKQFYKITGDVKDAEVTDVKILSYNVHLFNKFDWMPNVDVTDDVTAFVKINDADIVCLQEFTPEVNFRLKDHKYKHIVTKGKHIQSGLAIYSKFPIVNKGNLNFDNSNNNCIYADINVNGKTVRVYSMHLESVGIAKDLNEDPDKMDEAKSRKIFNRLKVAFADQQIQADKMLEHRKGLNIPVIVCGDMNNSAYSYVYRTIRGDLNDSFVESGRGFGKSYDFDLFPARIDYIFTDKSIEVKEFTTHNDFKKSDHFPIITRFNFVKDTTE